MNKSTTSKHTQNHADRNKAHKQKQTHTQLQTQPHAHKRRSPQACTHANFQSTNKWTIHESINPPNDHSNKQTNTELPNTHKHTYIHTHIHKQALTLTIAHTDDTNACTHTQLSSTHEHKAS